MKFLASLLSIAGLLSCISGSAAASQTHSLKSKVSAIHAKVTIKVPLGHAPAAAPAKVAPADEYFGRLKMSILGIRNTLKDLALKADYNPANAEQVFGTASFTEEALHEWEHKYPGDPWLAKTVAGLVHLYAKVPTPQGHAKMHAALAWLTTRYGSTKSLIAAAKAEADAADAAIVSPAAAATTTTTTTGTAPDAQLNSPAPAASNAPAVPNKP